MTAADEPNSAEPSIRRPAAKVVLKIEPIKAQVILVVECPERPLQCSAMTVQHHLRARPGLERDPRPLVARRPNAHGFMIDARIDQHGIARPDLVRSVTDREPRLLRAAPGMGVITIGRHIERPRRMLLRARRDGQQPLVRTTHRNIIVVIATREAHEFNTEVIEGAGFEPVQAEGVEVLQRVSGVVIVRRGERLAVAHFTRRPPMHAKDRRPRRPPFEVRCRGRHGVHPRPVDTKALLGAIPLPLAMHAEGCATWPARREQLRVLQQLLPCSHHEFRRENLHITLEPCR